MMESQKKKSLDLSKEEREDCKKLLAVKLKEVNQKGGNKKWVVGIRGQPGAFNSFHCLQKNSRMKLIELFSSLFLFRFY